MSQKTENQNDSELGLELKQPRKYQVVFYNDDYTPMEFVIEILMEIFQKNQDIAIQLTNDIHQKGKAVVATYPKNIAVMKVKQVTDIATLNEYPLKCTMEAV